MYYLDIQTMLFITVFVLFWLGSLMLLASFQLRRDPCLFWMAMGPYLASIGLICSALTLSNLALQVIWLGNIILITAHACMWYSLCRFSGRKPPIWILLAGAVLWSFLCLNDDFMTNPVLRVTVYSLICIAYVGAAALEVRFFWRKNLKVLGPMVAVMLAYMLAYSYRIFNWQYEHQFWIHRLDSTVTIFASLLVSIGMAFFVLTLVKGREEEHYRSASLHDDLTGLLNRRALFGLALPLLESSSVKRESAALLMLDLDWFKRINDQYGHQVGDQVLSAFANILDSNHRKNDLCARIGGEEFVVLLLNANKVQTNFFIERINNNLAERNTKTEFSVSVSIGVAWAQDHDYSLHHMLMAADRALYRAKEEGRNCVRFWSRNMTDKPIKPELSNFRSFD